MRRPQAQTALGDFIAARREELGLTLEDVAEELPITAATLGDIENGRIERPPDDVLRALASALDVSFERLQEMLPDDRVEDIRRNRIRLLDGGTTLELLVYDEIGFCWWADGATAKSVQSLLAQHANVATIQVRINSPGGDVFEANAIRAQLQRHSAHVVVDVDGVAASAASVIAMAGDEIRMAEGSFMMIHEASGVTDGDATAHEKTAELLRSVTGEIAQLYARRSGRSVEEILPLMAAETWFTAQGAVDAGLADDVVHGRAVAACTALSRFNYRNTPRAIAKRKSAPRATRKDMTFRNRVCTALGIAADSSDEAIISAIADSRGQAADASDLKTALARAQAEAAALQAKLDETVATQRAAACDNAVATMIRDGRILANSDKETLFRQLYSDDPAIAERVAATWTAPVALGTRQSKPEQGAGVPAPGGARTPIQAYAELPAHLQAGVDALPGKDLAQKAERWFKANPGYATAMNVEGAN